MMLQLLLVKKHARRRFSPAVCRVRSSVVNALRRAMLPNELHKNGGGAAKDASPASTNSNDGVLEGTDLGEATCILVRECL